MKDSVDQDINTGDTVLYIPQIIFYERSQGRNYRWTQFHIGEVEETLPLVAQIRWPLGQGSNHISSKSLLKVSPDIRYQANENVKIRLLSTLKLQGFPVVTDHVQWFIDYLLEEPNDEK